jgi:alpha/beta superfamily hydrolase
VCHPHPLYGGTLHNKVVHRAAGTFHDLGGAVLRFNFRGVGASAGKHDRGVGELEDSRAALRWIEQRHPDVTRRWAAGFSFGSGIAARLAASEPAIERVILIAPPVRTTSFESMHTATVPKLVIQGTADVTCPLEHLERDFPSWAEPKKLVLVEGATHFFDRQLAALGDALRRELEPALAG